MAGIIPYKFTHKAVNSKILRHRDYNYQSPWLRPRETKGTSLYPFPWEDSLAAGLGFNIKGNRVIELVCEPARFRCHEKLPDVHTVLCDDLPFNAEEMPFEESIRLKVVHYGLCVTFEAFKLEQFDKEVQKALGDAS